MGSKLKRWRRDHFDPNHSLYTSSYIILWVHLELVVFGMHVLTQTTNFADERKCLHFCHETTTQTQLTHYQIKTIWMDINIPLGASWPPDIPSPPNEISTVTTSFCTNPEFWCGEQILWHILDTSSGFYLRILSHRLLLQLKVVSDEADASWTCCCWRGPSWKGGGEITVILTIRCTCIHVHISHLPVGRVSFFFGILSCHSDYKLCWREETFALSPRNYCPNSLDGYEYTITTKWNFYMDYNHNFLLFSADTAF